MSARSVSEAAEAVCVRSRATAGPARDWEMACMRIRSGTAARMTSVSAQEREKARTRQVRQVVRYWTSIPDASEDAIRTSSVSL